MTVKHRFLHLLVTLPCSSHLVLQKFAPYMTSIKKKIKFALNCQLSPLSQHEFARVWLLYEGNIMTRLTGQFLCLSNTTGFSAVSNLLWLTACSRDIHWCGYCSNSWNSAEKQWVGLIWLIWLLRSWGERVSGVQTWQLHSCLIMAVSSLSYVSMVTSIKAVVC